MQIKRKEAVVTLGLIVLLLVLMIGVSYAAFKFTGSGTKVNTITTGSISMTYSERDNVISLSKALPTTDKTGKTLDDYFEFTVSSNISGDTNINYEISAKAESNNTFDGENVKLYLTKLNSDGSEEELKAPETYNEEVSANDYTGCPAGEMSLYTSSMNASESNTYRLRMWVSEEYNPQDDGGNLTFSVKVNVYGKDGIIPTAVETLLAKVNEETLDYNSASSGEKKEMWTFSHPATEQTEALTDYRYIGANPNNYVTFNNEVWRIIGVFSVDDGTGNVEQRLKLIRDESIGNYSWDNTFPYGTNNWTDARLNYLLNEGHDSEENGGSLYWNSESGTCYYGHNNATVPCDFTTTGLGSEAKNMIGDTLWYLGGSNGHYNVTTSMYYERERGTTVYSGGDTSWVGKVGLMYPSDYGYATSGGTTTVRNTCLNEIFNNWLDLSDCYTNNWLFVNSSEQWTLTSDSSSGSARTMLVTSNGWIISWHPNSVDELGSLLAIAVRPAAFLKSNIKIVDGDGSSSNPYILQS